MKTKFKIFTKTMAFLVIMTAFSCTQDDLSESYAIEEQEEFVVANLTTSVVQAENYDVQRGIRVVGGSKVGFVNNGDWIRFEDFDYDGASSVSVRGSSDRNGGTIEFRAGGPNSDLLGTVSISNTGGWNSFRTFTGSINDDSNNSDLYLVFKGGSGSLFDVDSFTFSGGGGGGGGTPSGTNLALGKSAQQSSTAYNGAASRAIDGNTSGVWNQNSVTHTSNSLQPWWQVQLGQNYDIGEIKIWNRTNCCSTRLSNFDVFVYNSSGSQVYKTTITGTPNPSVTINTGGVTGSRVRVKLKGTNPLSLAEVQVFGEEGNGGGGGGGGGGGQGGSAAAILGGLTNWKLNAYSGNLNVGSNDNGLDYVDSASKSDNNDWLYDSNGYAYFKTYPGNPTSGGSSNPRTELRELTSNGSSNINWNGTTNTEHSMKWRVRVDDLPPSGKVCFGQIHAESGSPFDDLVRIQVQGSSGQNSGNVTLRINGYVTEELLGGGQSISNFTFNMDTEYYFELTMRNGIVRLYILNSNGSRTSTLFTSGSVNSTGNYFKAGCYLQSTSSSDSGSNTFGLVGIKSLTVSH